MQLLAAEENFFTVFPSSEAILSAESQYRDIISSFIQSRNFYQNHCQTIDKSFLKLQISSQIFIVAATTRTSTLMSLSVLT
jgi:hypothetical protein